ncbi:MAG: methyltransferase domain-containing protein [Gammaproteobacteria bacterium]|nr:methyltransferase domain-containing protein [Gammaproteobacteria bacterium]
MSTQPATAAFDAARAEAFAERLVSALNDGALCLMTSVGHRTGLFDAMSALAWADSAGIAAASGLDERYVREWLGAMTMAGVVEHDPAAGRYRLPPEHASSLSRRSAADNIAVFAQYIPLLGSVEDDIVECFRQGGGVPYERYPRFHEVMAEDSGQTVLSSLLDHILPLVPGLVDRLEQGIDVLDAGCGAGRALNLMAARFPSSRFVGYDLSGEAIGRARAEATERGLINVELAQRDLGTFDADAEPERFDLVTTFDAVHDQARPLALLTGIRRTLRPDGVYLMQDIHSHGHVHENVEHPIGTLLYTISCMHCMTVSLAQGGEGLGAMWGREKARGYLDAAGFSHVEIHRLDHDFQNDYYVIRK